MQFPYRTRWIRDASAGGGPVTAVFAHRGCTDGFVENTLEAFVEARRLGADGVELDVRLTADGALAVHHDAEIPGLGVIGDARRWRTCPRHVPLLADVLAVCDGMTVNVEIKNAPQDPGWDAGEAVAALTAAADRGGRLDRPGHRVVVPGRHAAGRAGGRRPPGPGRAVGLRRPIPSRPSPRRRRPGFRAVHPFVTSVDPELVERAHARGLAVNVWTVNAPTTCAPWSRWGWTP